MSHKRIKYPSLENIWLYYSELTVIQKINVKANNRAFGERYGIKDSHAAYVAVNNLHTFQYDTPFYFSGANPIY